MPITDEDADLESTIGTAATVARKTHDDVHHAMLTSALPYHRGHDGRRVVRLVDLLESMRNVQSTQAHAAE
jgi:hypothetical protein